MQWPKKGLCDTSGPKVFKRSKRPHRAFNKKCPLRVNVNSGGLEGLCEKQVVLKGLSEFTWAQIGHVETCGPKGLRESRWLRRAYVN